MGAIKIAKQFKLNPEDVKRARAAYYKKESNQPRILIFDIETSPLKAYVWRRWKQNIHLDQTLSEWFMISWAAKWLDEPEVMGEVLTPEEILKEDDSRITLSVWKLVD